jgi:hypothetical protein
MPNGYGAGIDAASAVRRHSSLDNPAGSLGHAGFVV